MTSSLIITTYNWSQALELVLISALNQSELPNEIIIADDGSDDKTKELILKYMELSSVPIIHVWQEDDGFRAARSRNLAISKSNSDYIIVTDGDMILHESFIQDHKAFAKRGFFTQGTRVLLGEVKSNELLLHKSTKVSFFDNDIKNRKNAIYSPLLSKIFSRKVAKISGIKTCNMAFFRDDCYSVNGFNENFIGWGREDTEFAIRLLTSGIYRQDLRFKAIAYHIWHQENSRVSLQENDELLEYVTKNKLQFCENGIDKH